MTYVLALGTNIGNRKENIDNAVESINLVPKTSVIACSSIYETEPVGYDEQDDVYQKEGVLHGKARGVENHGARTGQAARGDFVGQLEAGEARGIHEQTKGDGEVVAHVLQNGRLENGGHSGLI